MTTSEPIEREDLDMEYGKATLTWLEYRNCTAVSVTPANRGLMVASPLWTGTIAVPGSAIHATSQVRSVKVGENFGTMIVMRRAAEAAGMPIPVVQSEEVPEGTDGGEE